MVHWPLRRSQGLASLAQVKSVVGVQELLRKAPGGQVCLVWHGLQTVGAPVRASVPALK